MFRRHLVLVAIQKGTQHASSVDLALVCKVRLLFVHTVFDRLEIVIAALPILLLNIETECDSGAHVYVKSWTRLQAAGQMFWCQVDWWNLASLLAFFLRLIVSTNSLHTVLRRFMSYCSPSSVSVCSNRWIIDKKKFASEALLTYVSLGFQACKIEQLAISSRAWR